jgi:hypothetical protein
MGRLRRSTIDHGIVHIEAVILVGSPSSSVRYGYRAGLLSDLQVSGLHPLPVTETWSACNDSIMTTNELEKKWEEVVVD